MLSIGRRICEIRSRFVARHGSTKGQILLAFALVFPVLLVMAGLVMDGGRLYFQRREAQVAADAGARAAAFELLRGRNTQGAVDEASRTDAALNGFDNSAAGTTVTAEIGPTGYTNNFVQVTVTDTVPATFMRVLSRTSSTVAARAIAGVMPDTEPPCVLALNPTASGALTMNGTSNLNAGCKVMVNSNADDSIVQNGSGACINANAIGFVAPGSFVTNGGVSCLNPMPEGQAIPDDNPYEDLTPPSPSDYPLRSNPMKVVNEGNVASESPLQPGYYRRGIFISSTVTINLDMDPGVYIVDGFNAGGNAVIRGTDVTIIDLCGSGPLSGINISGTVDVQLSAPTSGDYANILFYSTCAGPEGDIDVTGTAGSTFEGVIYAPLANARFGGNQTADAVWGMLIADTITFNGNPNFSINWDDAGRTSNVMTIGLVE